MNYSLIHLSSKDRQLQDESYDMTAMLGDAVTDAKAIQVVDIILPQTNYLFNQASNKIYFREASHPEDLLVCSLPTNITALRMQDLCDIVQYSLTNTPGARNKYRCVFLNLLNKLRIYSVSFQGDFKILSEEEVVSAGYALSTSAQFKLGFINAMNYTSSAIGDSQAYLYDPCLYVTMDLINGSTISSDGNRNVAMKVCMNQNFGGWCYSHNFLTDNTIPINNDTFNSIKITVTDIHGQYYSLNGLDWYMTLKVIY